MSDRTSALLDVLHSGERLDPGELRELYAEYGCELLGLIRAFNLRTPKPYADPASHPFCIQITT